MVRQRYGSAAASLASGTLKPRLEFLFFSWQWNFEILANLASQKLENFSMAWNSGGLSRVTIDIDGMASAFPEEFATVTFQVADKIAPFHQAGTRNGSRITSCPARVSSAN